MEDLLKGLPPDGEKEVANHFLKYGKWIGNGVEAKRVRERANKENIINCLKDIRLLLKFVKSSERDEIEGEILRLFVVANESELLRKLRYDPKSMFNIDRNMRMTPAETLTSVLIDVGIDDPQVRVYIKLKLYKDLQTDIKAVTMFNQMRYDKKYTRLKNVFLKVVDDMIANGMPKAPLPKDVQRHILNKLIWTYNLLELSDDKKFVYLTPIGTSLYHPLELQKKWTKPLKRFDKDAFDSGLRAAIEKYLQEIGKNSIN